MDTIGKGNERETKSKDASLDSLIDDFKGVGPSMHVDEVKALIGLNSIIPYKTKSDTKRRLFRFFQTPTNLYIFCSNATDFISLIQLHPINSYGKTPSIFGRWDGTELMASTSLNYNVMGGFHGWLPPSKKKRRPLFGQELLTTLKADLYLIFFIAL